MVNRDTIISQFLLGTPWENWDQHPLDADASARRYIRLHCAPETVILMDADPAIGQDTQPFAEIAGWLTSQGLCPPQILKHDRHQGLMLLEDLGPTHIAAAVNANPKNECKLYQAATDVLITLDAAEPLEGLPVMTPTVGGDMLEVLFEWYTPGAEKKSLTREMSAHLAAYCGPANRVALRDYHAENLIWRPDQTTTNRVGLLDFQDAFIAPRGYDLVSLIRDVRREVHPDVAAGMIKQFADIDDMPAAFACLAVQRNLRILGVFARLALRDGKTRYMQMIPHLWRMITEDIRHPDLVELRNAVQATLPPPDRSAIKDIL